MSKTTEKREITLPMQTREATVVPATIDTDKRTIDVCWSTGARVRRYDWWNDRYYDEELSLDDGDVEPLQPREHGNRQLRAQQACRQARGGLALAGADAVLP